MKLNVTYLHNSSRKKDFNLKSFKEMLLNRSVSGVNGNIQGIGNDGEPQTPTLSSFLITVPIS